MTSNSDCTYWVRIQGGRIEFYDNRDRKGKPIRVILTGGLANNEQ